MIENNQPIRRPVLYIFAAAIAIAVVVPLAISSSQTQTAGIFDECYGVSCDSPVLLADAGE